MAILIKCLQIVDDISVVGFISFANLHNYLTRFTQLLSCYVIVHKCWILIGQIHCSCTNMSAKGN